MPIRLAYFREKLASFVALSRSTKCSSDSILKSWYALQKGAAEMLSRSDWKTEASLIKTQTMDGLFHFKWSVSVAPINLDTALAKLHVFHLCDILNAIKSWLWKCARTSLWRRQITDVINMQTSSRWQARLGFENLNYFCVIIYLPVHRFLFLISSRAPRAKSPQLYSVHLYLWRARDTEALKLQWFFTVMYCIFTGCWWGRARPTLPNGEPFALWALNMILTPTALHNPNPSIQPLFKLSLTPLSPSDRKGGIMDKGGNHLSPSKSYSTSPLFICI